MKRSKSAIIAAAVGLLAPACGLWAEVLPNPAITASADPFSAGFTAANVFNSARSEFATSGNAAGTPLSSDPNDGTWINFDFGAPATIDRFIMISRSNAVDLVGQSRLIFSNDPIFDLDDPAVLLDPSGTNGQGLIQSFDTQIAQYVRWEVTTSTGASPNLGSQEMRFLNTPVLQVVIPGVTVINSAPAFNPTFAAANAVNGDAGRDPGQEYASQGQGANMFIDFDLGSSQLVTGFDYFDRLSETEDVAGFDLIFSDDPTFTTIIETKSYSAAEGEGYSTTDNFDEPVIARYVRLDATFIDGAGTNTGVAEMLFYTPIPEPTSAAVFALAGLAALSRRRKSAGA